mgnify:CR=1 FL=1
MSHPHNFVDDVMRRCSLVVSRLKSDPVIGSYVDPSLDVPRPFHGSGDIQLILLGQDPTVEDAETRRRITTVLMLDEETSNLRRFVCTICKGLGLSLDANVYATNVCKNFFTSPPESISDPDLIVASWEFWQDCLRRELDRFPEASVVTLGSQVLKILVTDGCRIDLKHYWGHVRGWKTKGRGPFQFVEGEQSTNRRRFFPLPHITNSTATELYREHFDDYLTFIRSTERQVA